MSRKLKVLLSSYLAAALIIFSAWLGLSVKSFNNLKMRSDYASGRAFEETLWAVDALSQSLGKSVYAKGAMGSRLCAEICAEALAAETAMSTLPFATAELRELSTFLNMSGDYAYALNYKSHEQGFTEQERETLKEMAELSSDFSQYLQILQRDVNSGEVLMDSRVKDFKNVFAENEAERLSQRLLSYEKDFKPMDELVYDGRFGKKEESVTEGSMSPREMAEAAADFVGAELSELQKEYDYEGQSGRSCFSTGDMHICVSPAGVESVSNSGLVGDVNITKEEAEKAGENFLKEKGWDNLELTDSKLNGAICSMSFARLQGDALCRDELIRLSISMDDGSLYDFNASDFKPGDSEARWEISPQEAAGAIPENLTQAGVRKLILKSPGGRELACYEFSCTDSSGRGVKIYADGETGQQIEIKTE